MARQYSTPYFVSNGQTNQLVPVSGKFNEDWLQNFVFNNYQSIPITQIEPIFADLIPVCREIPTKSGPIDILFINRDGLLTVVECKLWKNPQARREVVGQILDYAKEISRWSYEELESRAAKARKENRFTLFELVKAESGEVSEEEFIDNVTRNINKGRFLLLILGDGIRENVEQIAEYLQSHAHLNFSFALIEYAVFELPNSMDQQYFIQPRVLAQTVEIERFVLRMDVLEKPNSMPEQIPFIQNTSHRRMKISELDFFERLELADDLKENLKALFQRTDEMGLYLDRGVNSLMLKAILFDFNFGTFQTDGRFNNNGAKNVPTNPGHPDIGETYLIKLAQLFPSARIVKKAADSFFWGIRISENGKDRLLSISEILSVQEQWLLLIQDTLNQLAEIP